jgi:hypothetical protein
MAQGPIDPSVPDSSPQAPKAPPADAVGTSGAAFSLHQSRPPYLCLRVRAGNGTACSSQGIVARPALSPRVEKTAVMPRAIPR